MYKLMGHLLTDDGQRCCVRVRERGRSFDALADGNGAAAGVSRYQKLHRCQTRYGR